MKHRIIVQEKMSAPVNGIMVLGVRAPRSAEEEQ